MTSILVILKCMDDETLVWRLLLDAELHVIADRLWEFLIRANRGEFK
jgi:hypothetical protein